MTRYDDLIPLDELHPESLERRAEELLPRLDDMEQGLLQNSASASDDYMAEVVHNAKTVIEQLLSENRQVRETLETVRDMVGAAVKRAEAAEARVRELDIAYEAAASTLKDKIDRISAEREAYRTFIEEIAAQKNTNTTAIGTGGTQTLGTHTHLAEQARRILAENDR